MLQFSPTYHQHQKDAMNTKDRFKPSPRAAGPQTLFIDIQSCPQAGVRCLGCVLRVIVLLEGEHLAQSEELSASDQIQVGVRSSLSPSPSLSLPATFCLVFTGLSIKG